MDSRAGDRGVSEVMGFILVFGMLVISFTVYQGIVVPDQNRQVEFQHNQEVQGQLQELRNAIVTTSAMGVGHAVSVTLGASYPRRALALNLGVSGGSIQTTDGGGSLQVANARALDPETADHLNGTPRTFETRSIRYDPVYSFYTNPPETIYENSLVFNRFDAANVTLTDQVIVDGRRISLIAVDGTLSAAERDTISVDTKAISASSNRVAVTNTGGERVNITIPTHLSVAEWEEILSEELESDAYVEGVYAGPGDGAVTISMAPDETYELRMAKVGVGGGTSEEPPAYITDVEGNATSVPEGGTQKLVVEVRDRFNNPVSNVPVDAEIETTASGDDDSLTPDSGTTVSDGRVAFTYEAPADVDGTQTAQIDVTFGPSPTEDPQIVEFQIRVLDTDGTGGGPPPGAGGP